MLYLRILAAVVALAAVLGVPDMANAASEKPWYRYENRFFIAWSNASERVTRKLLEDLEEFRAAISQIGNFPVPADAPRTLVLITASKADFDRMKPSKNVVGFAGGDGNDLVIVMPPGGGAASTIIRHEFGHVLMRYKKFRYPSWYEEGFAEIASAVVLTGGGGDFVIGKPTDRAVYNGSPAFSWEELFSEDFEPHKIRDLRTGSSAYAQAWLMAHYATLGDNGKNASKLQRYFDLIGRGEPHLKSFKTAFGFEAADAWKAALKDYSARMPYYTIKFKPGVLETKFTRAVAADTEFRPIMQYFEQRAIALSRPQPPADPRAALPGRWSPSTLRGGCEKTLDIVMAGDAVTVSGADPWASSPIPPTRFTLRQDPADPALLGLVPVPGEDEGRETMVFDLRSRDVACWAPEAEETECGWVLARCGG